MSEIIKAIQSAINNNQAWTFYGVVLVIIIAVWNINFGGFNNSSHSKLRLFYHHFLKGIICIAAILLLIVVAPFLTPTIQKIQQAIAKETPTPTVSITTTPVHHTGTPKSNPTKVSGGNPGPGPIVGGPQPTPRATSTPRPKSTPHPTPTPTPPSGSIFFGFDGSTDGWGTSEGGYKLAQVSDASSPVYSGSGSLDVTTTLTGTGSPNYNGNSVYTHTEATDYFSPHSKNGATVRCYVYLPPGLAPGGSNPGYIRVFVKDPQFRNDFSDPVQISPSTVGRWVVLSFVIGANPNNEDTGFNASQVSAIGIRVDLYNGSTLNYTGPFYIDACSL